MSHVKLSKECVENALKISGYSKYRLAKESGKPLRTIQRWFNTDLHIDTDDLYALCVIMDVAPAYLMEPHNEIAVEEDGSEFVIPGYHEANKYTGNKLVSLSEEKKKRLDPNGIYVGHWSRDDMKYVSQASANTDCRHIFKKYINALIDNDLIENSDFIKNNDLIDDLVTEFHDNTILEINNYIHDVMMDIDENRKGEQ